MTESLIRTWRTHAAQTGAGMHLVDSDHPLQFFVGRNDQDLPRVVIRGRVKPQKPNLSGLVHVDRFEDQSAMWNLSLTLEDARFQEVFLRLADDMHARTATAPNETIATDRVGSIIDEWRRLLTARATGVLTMEELRGLIGELWLVLHWFTEDRSLEAAIEGWLGPLGLPQDFWFEQDGYHEAKAIGPSTTRVRISSAEQLDQPDMQLLVLLVANVDENQPGAVSLPTIVNRVHASLTSSGASDGPFLERLEHMGIDLADSFYLDTWFIVSRVSAHRLTEEFPAIRASGLPDGVDRVTYAISVDAIEPFRTRTMEVH
jgi:hypothetical protein